MKIAPYRIGFDARLAGPRHAGIGRYAEELLRVWLTEKTADVKSKKQPVQWVVWVSADHGMNWLNLLAAKGEIEMRETKFGHYTVAEQILWWWELRSAQLDWLHVPHFNVPLLYKGKFSITLHDLLWHQRRDASATTLSPFMHTLKYWAYHVVSALAVKRAECVFVPSQVVAKDVKRLLGRKTGVFVTPEGVGEVFRRAAAWTEKKLTANKKNPYIVITGSLYPHKNIFTILKVLRLLPNWRLKVVGSRNVFADQVRQQAERMMVLHKIDFLGYVEDEEIISLYQSATALVFPSLSEGFGLPGLEALACGTPIVVSDLPVFHEIYTDFGKFVPALDVLAWKRELQSLEKKPPQLNWRRMAQKFAREYSWEKMAADSWKILQQKWA